MASGLVFSAGEGIGLLCTPRLRWLCSRNASGLRNGVDGSMRLGQCAAVPLLRSLACSGCVAGVAGIIAGVAGDALSPASPRDCRRPCVKPFVPTDVVAETASAHFGWAESRGVWHGVLLCDGLDPELVSERVAQDEGGEAELAGSVTAGVATAGDGGGAKSGWKSTFGGEKSGGERSGVASAIGVDATA